jgi:glycosyltransferase involved in cell wall biosynthesis
VNGKPLVSCICPTYGRAPGFLHLLEEAVESFNRQDYPEALRELIIVNDCPGQELACGSPGVRVMNLPRRFSSLGEKYNWAISQAQGSVILTWEDDDISLPHRISQAVEKLGDAAYWNPRRSWFLDLGSANPGGPGLHHKHNHGVNHNASAFQRLAWEAVGGYPHISGAQDAAMDQRLMSLGSWTGRLSDDPGEWSYIYRWGVSPCHLSGDVRPDAFYARWGMGPTTPGVFHIKPHWRMDYSAMCAEAALGSSG